MTSGGSGPACESISASPRTRSGARSAARSERNPPCDIPTKNARSTPRCAKSASASSAASPRDRVSFELHRRMLAEFVRPGDRVLEIGAGPGRFTIELARLGALVTVTDISPVQLASNERHIHEAGYRDAVESCFLLDVR